MPQTAMRKTTMLIFLILVIFLSTLLSPVSACAEQDRRDREMQPERLMDGNVQHYGEEQDGRRTYTECRQEST